MMQSDTVLQFNNLQKEYSSGFLYKVILIACIPLMQDLGLEMNHIQGVPFKTESRLIYMNPIHPQNDETNLILNCYSHNPIVAADVLLGIGTAIILALLWLEHLSVLYMCVYVCKICN